MKSSVPWLLISSAITLPLSSILAAEEAVAKVSEPQEAGKQTLGTSDNYDGTSQSDTPFTCKNSSTTTGTTYTLQSDVAFANITQTQAPTVSQPEVQSQPKQPVVENNKESENGKDSSDENKANTGATSEEDRSKADNKVEESSSTEVSQPDTTVVNTGNSNPKPTEDTESTSNSGTETSSMLPGILRADATLSDGSSLSSEGSQIWRKPKRS
ncbi:hypothetical protein [Chlamydia poikilotherma]|uniref:hypothetical protein n=1 Tax=Chlamydia poikilotherma TaxID=1967783 RepID=UPI0018D53BD4